MLRYRTVLGLILLLCGGCGQNGTPQAALDVAGALPVAAAAEKAVLEPMTEQELTYCAAMGRIQIEEAVRAKNPDAQTTASIKAGGAQVILLPEGNEFRATHLMIRQVEFYLQSGGSFIQMWGIYCKGGEPVGAQHLFLGQQMGEPTF